MSQVNDVDDPGGRFSVEIFPSGGWKRKKKEAKKKEREGPWKMTPLMEILQNRISTVACKTLRVSHISHRPHHQLINEPDSTLKKLVPCPKNGEHLTAIMST